MYLYIYIIKVKAFTYIQQGKFGFTEKGKPTIIDEHDAIVRVTLSSICTSDLHIKHGSVPRAVPGITVGHEMVGIVEKVGERVSHVKPGDRVSVNVETFCGVQAWIREQLYISTWRMGTGMQNRWRADGICEGSLCYNRLEQDS